MTFHGEGLPPGTRIEEFEIVRELGSGGFGITYLARDHTLERQVCVKEFFPRDWGTRKADGTIGPRSSTAASDYAWGLERFAEEARVLARLQHPGIVGVFRIMEAGGTAYTAMEYVEGRSLAEELEASGPLPESRVRDIVAGLAGGLADVHAAGLLHRDIKPGNVMLRSRDGSPVLIDFGAARQQMGQQSRSITTVLTPGYAPIEQYSARGRQGPWTDVYALGAVAYAALSGRAPDDATERVVGDEMPSVERVAASAVGEELAGAVMAALATDAKSRPQEMGEFVGLLGGSDAVGAGPAAIRTSADDGSRSRSPGRVRQGKSEHQDAGARRRIPVLAVGGVVALVLGAAALIIVLARGGGPESEEEALGLSHDDRVQIQRGLLALGHDPGQGGGVFGDGTRQAIGEWQSHEGLEATRYLTGEAAEALRQVGR